MRLLPASYVASVRGAAHAAVRKAMLTPDALYYASDIKPAAYCNENPGGPCIVVCTNQRNATLCASRQPAVQHLNNPENLSKRARPPLARAGLFILYGLDGSKTVESVGVNGCRSGHGMVAHGPPSDPSLRVDWVADRQRVFDFIGRLMCAQTTSGAKYLELLRQRQQLLPPSPSAPAKFKWK